MAGVAVAVTFFGYAVFYYGLCVVQGKTVGFLGVLWPKHGSGGGAGNTFTPWSDITAKTGKTAKGADTYGGGGTPGPVYVKGT